MNKIGKEIKLLETCHYFHTFLIDLDSHSQLAQVLAKFQIKQNEIKIFEDFAFTITTNTGSIVSLPTLLPKKQLIF